MKADPARVAMHVPRREAHASANLQAASRASFQPSAAIQVC